MTYFLFIFFLNNPVHKAKCYFHGLKENLDQLKFHTKTKTWVHFVAYIARKLCRQALMIHNNMIALLKSRDSTVVRALSSHLCGMGLIPAQCHKWGEIFVSSRLFLRVFLQVLWFSSFPKKPACPNSFLTRLENPGQEKRIEIQLSRLWASTLQSSPAPTKLLLAQ